MKQKTIKEMSASDLKKLIGQTVKEVMEEYLEDMLALSSRNYLKSIKEAREDYRKGRVKTFEEVFKDL